MCENCQDCKTDCNKNKKLPLITSSFLTLTESCPLACEYCFVNQNPRHMTLDIAKRSADMLIQNALIQGEIPNINFFGGEPLMKWNEIIVPLVEYIKKDLNTKFSFSITTNGILLDKEKMEFMKKYKFGMLFSIDGDKETQDFNRPFHSGKGSFNTLKDKIPMVLEYYPDMTFRATISNKTVQHTFHNIKFADECGYNNMFFVPNVFVKWTKEEKEELTKQMRLFSDWYITNARNGKIIRFNPMDVMLRDIKKINKYEQENKFREDNINLIGQGKCGLGVNRFACIGTDGVIYGCQEMTSNVGDIFVIGDIFNGVDDSKRLKLSSTFNKKIVKSNLCKDCKLNYICDGGCVANNFLINGDVNRPSDMWCFWQQLLLDEAIYICEILGNERNELFKRTYFGGDVK